MAHEHYREWLQTHVQGYRETQALHPLPAEPRRLLVEIIAKFSELPPNVGDIATHEASHYVLGCVIGLPVSNPRLIAGNPSVQGKVSIPPEPEDVDLNKVHTATLQVMALRMAAFYLAGAVGQCLAVGIIRTGNRVVIDTESADLHSARRVLGYAGIEGDRGLVWGAEYAQRCLAYGWQHVTDLAAEIREKPPSFD